jgi:hypothetical protein
MQVISLAPVISHQHPIFLNGGVRRCDVFGLLQPRKLSFKQRQAAPSTCRYASVYKCSSSLAPYGVTGTQLALIFDRGLMPPTACAAGSAA